MRILPIIEGKLGATGAQVRLGSLTWKEVVRLTALPVESRAQISTFCLPVSAQAKVNVEVVGKPVPCPILRMANCILLRAEQLSEAEATSCCAVTVALPPVKLTLNPVFTANLGRVVSRIVTIEVQLALLPALSCT